MALIFLSDVHLRLDRPERGRRLARLVETLTESDRLVVVGDLCDFWFASRQSTKNVKSCQGLNALAAFRARGGQLDLLPGNHDLWLGSYYRNVLGVGFENEYLDLVVGEVRYRAVHGHLQGARAPWKGPMEARWFLRAFRALPGPVATLLDALLDSTNSVHPDATNQKHLAIYRTVANALRSEVDVCVFGHIHLTHDDRASQPRMIVLGGWHHQSSYLRVAEDGEAEQVIMQDSS